MDTAINTAFDYGQAFSRNLGWVTAAEQEILRGKRVAIAGLGGVGGVHATTLARLGIGALNLSDLDTFDIANLNRQAGASMATLGRAKLDVTAETVRAINPEIALRTFPGGIHPGNVEAFLEGVDVYVDGLDFFAFDARESVFAAAWRKGIPAVTVAPIGMGAATLCFIPGKGMSFHDYFAWAGMTDTQRAVRFLVGLTPSLMQRTYLADKTRTDFAARKVPSLPMGVMMCAGVAATETLKLLLGRGLVRPAPAVIHYDAYRQKLVKTRRIGGNRNPLSRLAIWATERILSMRR